MAGEYKRPSVSRGHFLRQSAALGAGALLWPGARRLAMASGSRAPIQPPSGELLVTLQQITPAGAITPAINIKQLTNLLNGILQPLHWRLQDLQTTVIPGPHAAGPGPMLTVIRYRNVNPQVSGQSVFVAIGTILSQRSRVVIGQPSGTFLVSVTPNWAIAAAGSAFIEGGPGSPPAVDIACGKGWHFDFPTLPPASHFLTAGVKATVVVLDTAPSLTNLRNAAKRFPGNALLGEVVTQAGKPGHWHNALGPQPTVPKAQQRPCGASTPYAPYMMADHGLFVAGIVHDIAPTCNLMLVRVLNQWGASYLSDLVAGLARVSTLSPTVLNMSLTVRMPSQADLRAELISLPDPVVRTLLDEWKVLVPDACSPLATILQQLWSSNVFLVAATGNGSGMGPWPIRLFRPPLTRRWAWLP